jgi:hypothetical protein
LGYIFFTARHRASAPTVGVQFTAKTSSPEGIPATKAINGKKMARPWSNTTVKFKKSRRDSNPEFGGWFNVHLLCFYVCFFNWGMQTSGDGQGFWVTTVANGDTPNLNRDVGV